MTRYQRFLTPPPQGQPPWYPGANGGVSFGDVAPANPIRGHFWWDGDLLWVFDGINWVTDGFSKALFQQMVAEDPSLIVTPVVTDGSFAPPRTVGELWTATATGSWGGGGSNNTSPLVNMVLTSPALTPGDWDVWWTMILPSASGTNGVSAALCRLAPPIPAGALNNMASYQANIFSNQAPAGDPTPQQPMIFQGPTTPISISQNTGLVFNLYVWPSGLAVTGNYTMNVFGRRRR